MTHFHKVAGALLLGAAAIGLSACASGLQTQVSRYQAMPVPAGQTFYVVPANGAPSSLEFNNFASLVAKQLEAKGYRPAGAPQLATMLVKLDYGVDDGETQRTDDPLAYSRYGYSPYGARAYNDPMYRGYYDPMWGLYGRPYWSRYGYWGARSPFYYGWDDPFWYASPYAGYGPGYGPIQEYVVYKSHLDMQIVRRVDNAPLFEGHARARSQTDELGTLVPNLVEAMFTDFPGRSGETVKITVPARKN